MLFSEGFLKFWRLLDAYNEILKKSQDYVEVIYTGGMILSKNAIFRRFSEILKVFVLRTRSCNKFGMMWSQAILISHISHLTSHISIS